MKLLLWACILCVAFAKKKRFHFVSEGYNRHRYPINPSLSNPYPVPENDFSPFNPPKKNIPNYPGHPDPETGVASYPWILNNPGASVYNIPKIPLPTWLSPPLSAGASVHGLPPSSAVGPFGSENAAPPPPYEPQVESRTESPATGEFADMAINEPDEAELSAITPSVTTRNIFHPPAGNPAVPEHQSSNSFTQEKK
ncbi:proline-rich protein 27 isoform X2 [Erinaceus europaeus]|uniref:Proline-rich protein 27 isoform X2 n=1 Tax=Erinaceus europaeus TaxID=9365 RepID=A0ABM3X6Y1_ERIEU|nr:proline-rich protein 27 isoform X2 [Erinaceus europaeus]